MKKKQGEKGTVNHYAKYFALSKEAFRFLEEKGIIYPERDSSTGYRLYGFGDAVTIVNYKKFRSFGYSVHQIFNLLTDESVENQIHAFQKQQLSIQKEIHRQQKTLLSLQRRIAKLEQLPSMIDRYQIIQRPAFFWMETRKNTIINGNDTSIKTMEKWNRSLTAYSDSTVVWSLGRLLGRAGPIYAGQVMDADFVDGEDLGDVHYSSSVKCISSIQSFVYSKDMSSILFDKMLQHMAQEKMMPTGDGIAKLVHMYIDEEQQYHFTWELMIPIA